MTTHKTSDQIMAEWSDKRETIQHYDQIADVYNVQYHEEQGAKINAVLNNVDIEPNNIILDLGCGTGLLFEHIRNSGKLLVGLDSSIRLLEMAKIQAKRRPNITIIRGEADHTPFRPGIFHIVLSITLLQNMPNPLTTLHEIKRIGRCNVTIIVTALKAKFTREAFTRLLENAGLTPTMFMPNGKLKDHAVICKLKIEK